MYKLVFLLLKNSAGSFNHNFIATLYLQGKGERQEEKLKVKLFDMCFVQNYGDHKLFLFIRPSLTQHTKTK